MENATQFKLAAEIYYATRQLKSTEEDLEYMIRRYDQARKQRLSPEVLKERRAHCERLSRQVIEHRNRVVRLWARGDVGVQDLVRCQKLCSNQ